MSCLAADRKPVTIRLSIKPASKVGAAIPSSATSTINVPPLMTFSELDLLAFNLMNETFTSSCSKPAGSPKSCNNNNNSYKIEYWLGYPPKRLPADACVSQNRVQDYIQGGERVTAHLVLLDASPNKNAYTDTVISLPNKPSKRKAAAVAQANFIHQIQAQELMHRTELNKGNNSKKTSKSHKITISPNKTNIHSMQSSQGSKIPSSTKQVGLQLQTKKTNAPDLDSKDQMSVSLLSLFVPGRAHNGGTDAKTFRDNLRQAVIKAHDERLANIRYASISADAFHESKSQVIIVLPSETSGSKDDTITTTNHSVPKEYSCGTYCIRYSKGLEGKGYFEDHVEILSLNTLQQVVSMVYQMDYPLDEIDSTSDSEAIKQGQDSLRPRNMALLSPRVFWSLWFHFKRCASSMEEALQQLLPDLDWDFLSTGRIRGKSEKAKENIRQEQEKYVHNHPPTENEDKAMKHILDVENALNGWEATSQNNRCTVATQEYKDSTVKIVWELNTPSEVDHDELVECILNHLQSDEEKHLLTSMALQAAQIMSKKFYIRNWRELANADASNLNHQLSKVNLSDYIITESQVQQWIEAAQLRSLDEIMLEILNGDDDMYFILREHLQTGTPKDLKLWTNIPQFLLNEINPFLSTLSERQVELSTGTVKEWCDKADIALQTCSWLDEYITPLVEFFTGT